MIGTSCRTTCAWMTSGDASALSPTITSTLKMLLPITLPIARSLFPARTAPIETASSGELVPSATIVSPTTSGVTPNDSAIRDAPRTRLSAPASRARTPAMNRITLVSMGRAAWARRPDREDRVVYPVRAAPAEAEVADGLRWDNLP